MKKLNLPVIPHDLPPSRALSMDEYAQFVARNLNYFVLDRSAHRQLKARSAVNTSFVLKSQS